MGDTFKVVDRWRLPCGSASSPHSLLPLVPISFHLAPARTSRLKRQQQCFFDPVSSPGHLLASETLLACLIGVCLVTTLIIQITAKHESRVEESWKDERWAKKKVWVILLKLHTEQICCQKRSRKRAFWYSIYNSQQLVRRNNMRYMISKILLSCYVVDVYIYIIFYIRESFQIS